MTESEKLWHEKTEFGWVARGSNWLLRHSGPFTRIPPNLVTIAGGLLVLPMLWAFHVEATVIGAILFTVSQLTDWIDGALARYQHREHQAGRLQIRDRNEWLRLGPTELGKKLDPVIDKFRYIAALMPLGWNLLPRGLILCSIAIAFFLTFFREVVRLLWGLKPAANAVGKFKVHVEVVVIASLVLRTAWPWIETAALIVFITATMLGIASLFTQGQSIRRQVKEIIRLEDLRHMPILYQARAVRNHLKDRQP